VEDAILKTIRLLNTWEKVLPLRQVNVLAMLLDQIWMAAGEI